MGIKTIYVPDLQRVVNAYPKHFNRNKPAEIKKVWARLVKELKFTESDIDEIVKAIELRVLTGKSWQPGTGFGQGLQVWLGEHGWENEYKTIQRYKATRPEYQQSETQEREWTPQQRAESKVAMERAMRSIRH